MLRKLLYLGVATLVAMTISAVAFGEAVAPQARSGTNLLKASIEPVDTSQRRVQTDSLAVAAFSSTAFAPSAARGTIMMSPTDNTSPTYSSEGTSTPTIPEPFSMVLLGTGLVGLAAMMRKRR
jgi:hypothetical protein